MMATPIDLHFKAFWNQTYYNNSQVFEGDLHFDLCASTTPPFLFETPLSFPPNQY